MRTRRALLWLFGVVLCCGAIFVVSGRVSDTDTTAPRRRSLLLGVLPRVRDAGALQKVPHPGAPAPFVPADRIVSIEISEYAGYAGLIVANGGLEPSESSIFFRDHNFRVRLTVREKETFEDLNAGKLGATATTADVVALYGQDLAADVPVLIGFSRGADGVVARRDVNSLQDLKGKVVATAQFSEAEFLVRYLATRMGIGVNLLPNLAAEPAADRINLVFAENAFDSCDMLLRELILNHPRLAACAAWEPRTSEVVRRSGGAAHFLTTNRNLLIIADVLAVNRGLAEQNPAMVAGLVDGLLAGNQRVRDSPETALSDIAAAFNWSRDKTRSELAKVHLASMADNLDFFSGATNDVGSFAHIFEASLTAFGDLVSAPRAASEALHMGHLAHLQEAGKYAGRGEPVVSLRPLVDEAEPLVSLPAAKVIPPARPLLIDGRQRSTRQAEGAASPSAATRAGKGQEP